MGIGSEGEIPGPRYWATLTTGLRQKMMGPGLGFLTVDRCGRYAGVGAGAVVTRDVPTNTIVSGNLAQVIREIEQGKLAKGI